MFILFFQVFWGQHFFLEFKGIPRNAIPALNNINPHGPWIVPIVRPRFLGAGGWQWGNSKKSCFTKSNVVFLQSLFSCQPTCSPSSCPSTHPSIQTIESQYEWSKEVLPKNNGKLLKRWNTRWWFEIISNSDPLFGEDEPNLSHIFADGWFNH